MSVFNVFHIAGSALTAQSMRLNAVASNLANADSIAGSDGKPYRAKQVVFEATPMNGEAAQGVRVKQIAVVGGMEEVQQLLTVFRLPAEQGGETFEQGRLATGGFHKKGG